MSGRIKAKVISKSNVFILLKIDSRPQIPDERKISRPDMSLLIFYDGLKVILSLFCVKIQKIYIKCGRTHKCDFEAVNHVLLHLGFTKS